MIESLNAVIGILNEENGTPCKHGRQFCLECHKQTPSPADCVEILTEEMIDAPRYFLLGLELGIHTLDKMRTHLDRSGTDYSCWPEWAKTGCSHITKAGKAELIYIMMVTQ